MLFQLPDDAPTVFPNPHLGEEDGLLAIGGDLSPERLITAYSNGIFPWYGFKECEEIMWWCPMQRFVIFPSEIHISHSMRQLMRRGIYTLTVNQAFRQVIECCGKNSGRNTKQGAWLGEEMTKAYCRMYELGYAASVEVWRKPETPDGERTLAGGLYGIGIGRNFFGESMFSDEPNTSKLALIYLAKMVDEFGGIIDCQLETSHLRSMGGRFIPYDEYMSLIRKK